jgi:hypothetical protein
MNNSLLRSLIRETLLQESDSPTARAAAAGYAVARGESDSTVVMIYSPKILFEILDGLDDPSSENIKLAVRDSLLETSIVRSAVGYRSADDSPWAAVPSGPCWDSGIVSYAVSANDDPDLPRVGPAAYEAAMWYSKDHTLAPDRESVSSSAEKVWSRYSGRVGKGVDAFEFDDKDDPKTPEPDDDCWLQDSDVLNHAYALDAKPAGLDSLEKKHKECVKKLEREYFYSGFYFTLDILSLSENLFQKNYNYND